MSHLIYVFFFIGLLICNPGGLKAQALNDECNSAIELTNVRNWCSTGTPFNNISASASGFDVPDCFSGQGHDVWYSFTATATDITILLKSGSLRRPEAALYAGDCNATLNELECKTNLVAGGVLEMYQGGLSPGDVYFLRIQGEEDSEGTQQEGDDLVQTPSKNPKKKPIPAKYNTKSELQADVKPGENTFDFKLEKQ